MPGKGVHSSFWQAGGGPNNRIFEIDSGSTLGCNSLCVHVCSKETKEVPWGGQPDKETLVTCVFDRGAVRIFVDGRLVATRADIPHVTDDTTESGRFGSVNDAYLAVGDVIVANDKPGQQPARGNKFAKYAGSLRHVRVYKRALEAAEIKSLRQPESG